MDDLNSLSDENLIEIIRSDNKELYGEIIKRYQGKLSQYLRKFISNKDELEDTLQVVFIKAYQNIYGFDIKRKFSSWIYRIAHNEAINNWKKNKKRDISLEDVEYKIIDKEFDLEREFTKKDYKKIIKDALKKLKTKYQEPIILFYLEQKSYEEISNILRIPKNTVGVLISRGRNNLKEIINQYE